MNDVPLGADELRRIADLLDEFNTTFTKGGDYIDLINNEMVGDISIPINRPDWSEKVGAFIFYDGWIGFRPGDQA